MEKTKPLSKEIGFLPLHYSYMRLQARPALAPFDDASFLAFSYAYISLYTSTDVLILFGAVQITMILASLIFGNKLHFCEWVGILTAFLGFVYLVQPNLTTPSLKGFVLMTVSGIAWGIYTLKGKDSKQPIHDSASNFLYR